MPQAQPELKKVGPRPLPDPLGPLFINPGLQIQYLDKRLFVQLNGSRKVIGVLRGYDVFLNIVLDEAVEEKAGGEKVRIGMVVWFRANVLLAVIRGNSVVMLEALERIGGDRDR
ncbi:hypothetical protein ACLMJK_006930 [Lecanora helva]